MILQNTLLLFACAFYAYSQNPCPVESHHGTVHTAQILINRVGGFVPLIDKQDTQCYNYSLQYTFHRVPDVAVAVYEFESQSTENLHYFIKPLHSKSLSFIPFIIYTSWAYTRWVKISFSFLAQDRVDLQAGYYQVDSGSLGSCVNGKATHILLPYRTDFNPYAKIINHIFLHGFFIDTQSIEGRSRSPYQVQLAVNPDNTNSSGVALTLSVTTITQVNFIYVSYIAYQQTNLQILAGSFTYEGNQELLHAPQIQIGRSYARIHGIGGFIINYNQQRFVFEAGWTGSEFIFSVGHSAQLLQYFSYQYLFFAGSNCKDCPGYPITYDGKCVRFCPNNTFLTAEGICLSCGEGRYWNGTSCQKSCPQGQYLNATIQQCQCPHKMNWNGQACITCTQGKVFQKNTSTCECLYPMRWNGFACTRVAECTGGKEWNVYSYTCQCPSYLMEKAGKCVEVPRCMNGQILKGNSCICPPKTYWNGRGCVPTNCVGNQIWNGVRCSCRTGFNFNGKACIQCINGQVWDQTTRSCKCEDGYKWTGNYCKKEEVCSGGRVWNSTFEKCICPEQHYWAGNKCKIQPKCCCGQRYNKLSNKCECYGKSKWDGKKCVRCTHGKLWDEPSRKCVCPPGTSWSKNFCSVIMTCSGGMMWNQNTWSCQCPSGTVWNGHFCISNPCSKGRVWNDVHKSCQCPGDKVWQNEACIPPKIVCTNGQIWDPTIYACTCPAKTFQSINSCDPIPYCKGEQVYNPYNNKCQCPYGLKPSGYKCVEPKCPDKLIWNGFQCVVVNCPPLTTYKKGKCQKSDEPKDCCKKWEFWNGKNCLYFPKSCPLSTRWNGTQCSAVDSSCSQGYYKGKNHHCQPFPQKCRPPTIWNGENCQNPNNQCPDGTFFNGTVCMPYVPCQNGKIWSLSYLYCVCPDGTESNGNVCLSCPNGKIWVPGKGCECEEGKFDFGSSCQAVNQYKCENIPNSIWENNRCLCKQGFHSKGLKCICKGLNKGSYCQICVYKPHSQRINGLCQCISGYTEVYGVCVPNGQGSGNDNPSSCSTGTYFDVHQKRCLPCPEGCLSCDSCYTCKQCLPQFNYYAPAQRCIEHCGDGKRFIVQCDDGNNDDRDGCSLDCKVEQGYVCTGGSPSSKDNCRIYNPSQVTLSESGQIRTPTSIILNIKVNYLSKELLQSFDCNNECQSVLVGEILSGDRSSTSIRSSYIAGSSFLFSVEVEFGRNYIGTFKIRIKINPNIAIKYYGGIYPRQTLQIDVNPGYLSTSEDDELS